MKSIDTNRSGTGPGTTMARGGEWILAQRKKIFHQHIIRIEKNKEKKKCLEVGRTVKRGKCCLGLLGLEDD